MQIEKALAIMSGSLIGHPAALDWLEKNQNIFNLSLSIGAGEQTNKALKAAGFEIKFCPLGRIVDSDRELDICQKVAIKNKLFVHGLLKKRGIKVRILTPFDKSDGRVLVPLNGDLAMFSKYGGYDKIFRLTTEDRVKEKEALKKGMVLLFAPLAKGCKVDIDLKKIQIIGF